MKTIIYCITAILVIVTSVANSSAQNYWKQAGTVPGPVTAICGNAATGKIIAGTMNGIYTSFDTGATWKKTGTLNLQITALIALSSGTILIGTPSGLLRGTDDGNWNPTNITSPVTTISQNGLVGTQDGKIFIPDASFTTWTTTLTTVDVV